MVVNEKIILVVGGAGYIGSHTTLQLAQQGYRVVVLDSFVHGQVLDMSWATVIRGDFGDRKQLESIFARYHISAVMHFAGFIEVGESVIRPADFYHNNFTNTLQLLDVMRLYDVSQFIFSSSCAVYGNPIKIPMNEDHPFNPVSPYGRTKLAVEFALQDYATAYGLRYVSLRYFNAAGALPEFGLGEQHHPETHLIPLLFAAARDGKPIKIFGDDYQTTDGTCVRDYIHVVDIADAHLKAYEYLNAGSLSIALNLGTGRGYSVKELIQAAQESCDLKILTEIVARRPGDAAVLVADANKARVMLGWQPQHGDIHEILRSAYAWQQRPAVVAEGSTFKEKERV
jgi:UDP-glucose 4-epimerase